jgi:hypothetical protein
MQGNEMMVEYNLYLAFDLIAKGIEPLELGA